MSGTATEDTGPRAGTEETGGITGAARFVDDLSFSRPLHVDVLRAEPAHARIVSIDTERALECPGVLGVFTYADLRALCRAFPVLDVPGLVVPPLFPLADEEVCYPGQPVAAVVAESRRAARDALEAIQVEWAHLPPVFDPESAIEPGVPRAHSSLADNIAFRRDHRVGDVEAALGRSDRVIRRRIAIPRTAPHPLEVRGAVACFDPSTREMVLWTATEHPHLLRSQLSVALRMPEPAIRIIVPRLGGSFGSRQGAQPEDALVCALARLFPSRPLRWTDRRLDALQADLQGCAQVSHIAVGARRDGRLVALLHDAVLDIGAYYRTLVPLSESAFQGWLTGPYDVPAAGLSLKAVYTNRPTAAVLDSSLGVHFSYVLERAIDAVAGELHLDPIEIRRINAPRARESTASRSGGSRVELSRLLDALVETSSLPALRADVKARRERGEVAGIGVAAYSGTCAVGPSRRLGRCAWESATVRVGVGGGVEVLTGAVSQGQGLEETLSTIVAGVLRVKPSMVRVRWGDTASTPWGSGGSGGRTASVTGAAVFEAARGVERRMREIAAGILKAAVDYVEHGSEGFAAGHRVVSFEEVCFRAHSAAGSSGSWTPGLEATRFFEAPDVFRPMGAHLCVVTIDPETWEPRVERYHAVDDFGRILRPDLVERRLRGGIVRGLGRALREELLTEMSERSSSFPPPPYPLPRITDVPSIAMARLEGRVDWNPLGAGGVGESGVAGALSAITNAVMDALRGYGVESIDVPLLPEKLWRAVRRPGPPAGAVPLEQEITRDPGSV